MSQKRRIMKITAKAILVAVILFLSALSYADTPRKMVYWFEGGPFTTSMSPDAWIAQPGFALADDGTLWALLLDTRTDPNDPNSPTWDPTCSLANATQMSNSYAWSAYSTVSVPNGLKIVVYYPMSTGSIIVGRAIMDDGSLWTLVSTDEQCTCENSCANYGAFSNSGFAWYSATPSLPPIP